MIKHPERFDDYSPKEFVDKFVKTNYFYQQEVFKELVLRYLKESEGDAKRPSLKDKTKKRSQLASGLESLAEVFREKVVPVMRDRVLKPCKKYLPNPYSKN